MVRFDWDKIQKVSKGNIKTIINVLYWLTYRELPYHKGQPIYKIFDKDYSGTSFIINLDSLFYYKDRKFTKTQMVDYVYLASYRSYAEYKMTDMIDLPRAQSPFPLERVRDNPLLIIKQNNIKFKLEDTTAWH